MELTLLYVLINQVTSQGLVQVSCLLDISLVQFAASFNLFGEENLKPWVRFVNICSNNCLNHPTILELLLKNSNKNNKKTNDTVVTGKKYLLYAASIKMLKYIRCWTPTVTAIQTYLFIELFQRRPYSPAVLLFIYIGWCIISDVNKINCKYLEHLLFLVLSRR